MKPENRKRQKTGPMFDGAHGSPPVVVLDRQDRHGRQQFLYRGSIRLKTKAQRRRPPH